MKTKNILKGIMISIATLTVGYFALSIPFNLFERFNADGQRLFFAVEVIIYLLVGSIFLVVKDKKIVQAQKEKARQQRRIEKLKDVEENWYNIAA